MILFHLGLYNWLMKCIRLTYFLIFLLVILVNGQANSQELDQSKISLGISREISFTTLRLQSFSGNWKVELQPHLASSPSRLPPQTTNLNELLTEGEDMSLMLIAKGLIARFSTGKDLETGFSKAILTGGELLNIEIPDMQPMLLQGRIEIDFNELSIRIKNEINLHQHIVSSVSKFAMTNEPEALKAIIVMTRSRLANLKANTLHKEENFDLCDSDHCIAFQGCGYNRELVDILTTMTKNQVINYKGKSFLPRFHNTCGGKISSGKNVYNSDEPYHASKNDLFEGKGSENCFHSPGFHWSIELQKLDILDFLALTYAGGAERMYTSWEPEKIDENGRITQVLLKGRKPRSISGVDFFTALKKHFGPNSIKSMKFTMEILRRTIIFRGMGHGDGVGMCLYGTDGLAKKNMKHQEILQFYFPGTDLK